MYFYVTVNCVYITFSETMGTLATIFGAVTRTNFVPITNRTSIQIVSSAEHLILKTIYRQHIRVNCWQIRVVSFGWLNTCKNLVPVFQLKIILVTIKLHWFVWHTDYSYILTVNREYFSRQFTLQGIISLILGEYWLFLYFSS